MFHVIVLALKIGPISEDINLSLLAYFPINLSLCFRFRPLILLCCEEETSISFSVQSILFCIISCCCYIVAMKSASKLTLPQCLLYVILLW